MPGKDMLLVEVDQLFLSNVGFVVLLKGAQDERSLPIFIGAAEAQSIAIFINQVPIQRPLTHDLLKNLLDFMTESEVVPMILEKENGVDNLRKTIGATDPAEAENGTVRKRFAENKQNNIIHASDSLENAALESTFFFSKKEIIDNQI